MYNVKETNVKSVLGGLFLTFFVANTLTFAIQNFILFFFCASSILAFYANVSGRDLHGDSRVQKLRNVVYPFSLILFSIIIANHNYNIHLQHELGNVKVHHMFREQYEEAKSRALITTMWGFLGYYTFLLMITIYM